MKPYRQLPGYYYDPDKKKYFKILPNHIAPPGSQYSRENVNKRAKEDKRERDRKRHISTIPSVQRSKLPQKSVGGLIESERICGYKDSDKCRTARGRLYATSLERRWQWEISGAEEITSFNHDPVTGALFAGYDIGEHSCFTSGILSKDHNGLRILSSNDTNYLAPGSKLSSITISPSRTILYTFFGTRDGQVVIRLSKLVGPDAIDNNDPEIGHAVLLRSRIPIDVWTSTNPPYTHDLFVLGTSNGVMLLQGTADAIHSSQSDPSSALSSQWETETMNTNTDVFAVEFTSPWTFLAGQRHGGVDMIDLRTGEYRRTVSYLRHPSCVTHIRKVDDWHVVVNGLRNSIRMYDLRYPHPPSPMKSYAEPTPAVLEYPDHRNEYRQSLGFDVDVETGLMAVGREDKKIQLYTLHTAEKINNSTLSSTPNLFQDSFPRCIRFCAVRGEENPKSLMVSAGNTIYEVGW